MSQVNTQECALPPGPGTPVAPQNLLVDYLMASQPGAARSGAITSAAPMGATLNQGVQALFSLTAEQQTLLKLSSILSTINQSLTAEQVQHILNLIQQKQQGMMKYSGISHAQVSTISDVMTRPYQ